MAAAVCDTAHSAGLLNAQACCRVQELSCSAPSLLLLLLLLMLLQAMLQVLPLMLHPKQRPEKLSLCQHPRQWDWEQPHGCSCRAPVLQYLLHQTSLQLLLSSAQHGLQGWQSTQAAAAAAVCSCWCVPAIPITSSCSAGHRASCCYTRASAACHNLSTSAARV